MTTPKMYSEEEIKAAFYERYHSKSPQVDDYEARVTNAQWEMFLDYLKKPEKSKVSNENKIFVFGSNEAGVHGAGAALFARQNKGAIYGKGVGHVGNSYAIPTKDFRIKTLPLDKISKYVMVFLEYAFKNPELKFEVTRIGCGLAGYTDSDIAPMFINAPENCELPEGWRKVPDNT